MSATVIDSSGARITLPRDVDDLARFRAWVATIGENGPRAHLSGGEVWIDMSPQDYYTHLTPVTAINGRLAVLADELDLGRYHADGGWITHPSVGLSTQPDGFFVTWATFDAGAARFVPRPERGPIELVGRADMVLEVISDSSVHKDRVALMRAYASAGFPEYWIVDARSEPLEFEVHALRAGAYAVVAADAEGWVASPVWGRAFRLVRDTDRSGQPRFRLLVRPTHP